MDGESYVDDVVLRDAVTLWLRALARQKQPPGREQGNKYINLILLPSSDFLLGLPNQKNESLGSFDTRDRSQLRSEGESGKYLAESQYRCSSTYDGVTS